MGEVAEQSEDGEELASPPGRGGGEADGEELASPSGRGGGEADGEGIL